MFCRKKVVKYFAVSNKSSNFVPSKGKTPILMSRGKSSEVYIPFYSALWCNGSTPDSGSVCESSSLSKATLKFATESFFSVANVFFFIPASTCGMVYSDTILQFMSQCGA